MYDAVLMFCYYRARLDGQQIDHRIYLKLRYDLFNHKTLLRKEIN